MGHPKYPHVFSPIRLGPVEIPNRFFFAPHGSSLNVGTRPSDDLVAYTTERVRDGGCGLVIVAAIFGAHCLVGAMPSSLGSSRLLINNNTIRIIEVMGNT